MGIKTGRPRGRPVGAKSKRTRAREEKLQAAAAVIESAIPEAFKGDSHALLMAVYKDPTQPLLVRLDAAKAAIGYEKPRLASVEATVEVSKHEQAVEELSAMAVVLETAASEDHGQLQ